MKLNKSTLRVVKPAVSIGLVCMAYGFMVKAMMWLFTIAIAIESY